VSDVARYIDADALIENIKRVYCTDCNNYNEVRCRACGTDDAMAMIEDAPTADIAPRAEVAKEIFAEIRQCWARRLFECGDFSFKDFSFDGFAGDLDVLYKKYTEDNK
jgi:hypothetical protein